MIMKILIIDSREHPRSPERVSGGVEAVVEVHAKILLSLGHEVAVFLSSDSIGMAGTNSYYSGVPSRQSKANTLSGIQYNKRRCNALVAAIDDFEPDLIMNHDQSNNSIVKLLSSLENMSVTFVHNCTEVIGGIMGFGYVNGLIALKEAGKEVVNVSKTSMEDWRRYYEKNKKHLAEFDPKVLFSKHLYTPFFLQNKDSSVETNLGYGVVVSRMAESKAVHQIVKWHKANNLPLVVCYKNPRDEVEEACFQKVLKESYDNLVLKPDLPRNELLEVVKRANYIVVSGPEAGPLVVSEAGSFGVKTCLIYKTKEHPTSELVVNSIWIDKTVQSLIPSALKSIPVSTAAERFYLRDDTMDRYSVEALKLKMYEFLKDILRD